MVGVAAVPVRSAASCASRPAFPRSANQRPPASLRGQRNTEKGGKKSLVRSERGRAGGGGGGTRRARRQVRGAERGWAGHRRAGGQGAGGPSLRRGGWGGGGLPLASGVRRKGVPREGFPPLPPTPDPRTRQAQGGGGGAGPGPGPRGFFFFSSLFRSFLAPPRPPPPALGSFSLRAQEPSQGRGVCTRVLGWKGGGRLPARGASPALRRASARPPGVAALPLALPGVILVWLGEAAVRRGRSPRAAGLRLL